MAYYFYLLIIATIKINKVKTINNLFISYLTSYIMCLYTRNKQPMIANRDIKCLKYVTKIYNQYYSFCRNTRISIDQVMIASPSTTDIKYLRTDYLNYDIYTLFGGAIHAKMVESPDYGNDCLLAIIPKGTEYWINSWGTEIAAKQMLITSERGDKSKLGTSFAEDILLKAPEINGIRIADYLLEDGTFVRPTKNIAKLNPIGRVVGFYNDEPLVGALEYMLGEWDIRSYSTRTKVLSKQLTNWNKVSKDFDGKKWTKEISKLKTKDNHPAFNKCSNYRSTKEEEWYLPAIGELITMFDNTLYLNAATMLTGVGFIIDESGWYWSSSENNNSYSWICELLDYQVGHGWYCKNYLGRIAPFLASKNKLENTESLLGVVFI